jgi:hypothetical protein
MIDLLIYCVGYETRSGCIPTRSNVSERIALVFDTQHVHSFEANLSQAKTRNDHLLSTAEIDRSFIQLLKAELDRRRDSQPSGAHITVAVDVSSMTRRVMAAVLSVLYSQLDIYRFSLSILYATGEYLPPPPEGASFIDFAPAPGCEGWTKFPERPLSVVLGLGYEVDQAIGAIEYLDPSGIWAFMPVGSDRRFFKDLIHSNEALWPLVDRSHQLEYPVKDPYLVFSELRGLVASLSRRSRVVIVPGGPKLFSALSILTKLELGEEISIWRASTHEFNEPRDVRPAGEIVRFDYKKPRFQPEVQNEIAALSV